MANIIENLEKEYIQCQKDIEDWLLSGTEEKSEFLNQLLGRWDISLFMQVIFENYSERQPVFARYLKGCSGLKTKYVESRRIAIYYYRYGKGGVERVLSYLLPLYVQAGYSVLLLTDEEPESGDYFLSDKVRRYSIPKRGDVQAGRKKCGLRISKLIEILKEEKIDTLCYHAASNPLLFYDLAAVKSTGIKVIISKHELFSQYMAMGRDVLTNEINIYPLADMLTVLSREEEVFWKSLGINSCMVPNPSGEPNAEYYQYNRKSNDIVWVGRLDPDQKQYQEIVPVMQEVVKELPDCVINIYGSADGSRDEYLLNTQIKESGLERNVKYRGYCTEIETIYRDAGAILVTSAYESFSMIILESKQLGIPLVTYSMPYLELLKNKKGFIEVEQGDTFAAAKALVRILTDDILRNRLSEEAKESVSEYSNARVMEKWRQVLSGRSGAGSSVNRWQESDSYGIILRTLIFHQSIGCRKYDALRENYRQLKTECKINRIKELCERGKLKLALYPYGILGKRIRGWIEERHMDISLIVDNKLADKERTVLSVEDLKEVDISSYYFIICSDNFEIYDEIRYKLYEVVPQENIFDWFARDEERV